MALLVKILAIASLMLYNKGIQSATRVKRLSLAEPMPIHYYGQGNPGAYSFGYDVSDPDTGNVQYRKEERFPNGTVVGSYGYLDPFGRTRRYQYVADEYGYRVISNTPMDDKFHIVNGQKASTESSVTWTRPAKKKKKTQETTNVLNLLTNNKYLHLKPPSYYAIE
ncbi:PREDICTED: pupal cuticle protein Edg-84A-like [Papilio polytes]|uniref:pupal cuticle protein Edg-84A-like n=1 Tax=Papilio polytes TaxID=76194 RepID=UPI000675FF9E|nr:PREDICTED: pupal cuticle protein Edg-84A-like [Papilio polytes]